jgi:arylformamidase
MNQAELDAAYTQSVWAPNIREVMARYKSRSEAFLATVKPQRLQYGTVEVEGMDVYSPTKNGTLNKIHIFIHGGAWSGGTAAEYAFIAEPFLNAGACVVIPDFNKVQDLDGNLIPMADQVRRAIAFVYQNAIQFGGDPSQIYLSGHSSGGHLAAVALTTYWSSYGGPQDIIKGALICSGMYDLKPVRLSARSKYIMFTDVMEDTLSPQRHLEWFTTPTLVACGTKESPEFQRQSRDFVAASRRAKKSVNLIEAKGCNHFEILETLATREGVLGKAVVKLMGLK